MDGRTEEGVERRGRQVMLRVKYEEEKGGEDDADNEQVNASKHLAG